jgi:hypothetical protein
VTGSPRHVRKNRRDWDTGADEYQAEHAKQLNRFGRPVWGVWGIPESTLQVLGDVRGRLRRCAVDRLRSAGAIRWG